MKKSSCSVDLAMHGVAASSSPNTMMFLRDNKLAFSSHCVVNLASSVSTSMDGGVLYNVNETLCTATAPREDDTNRVITSLCHIRPQNNEESNVGQSLSLMACAFSDGTITVWSCSHDQVSTSSSPWMEHVIVGVARDGNKCNSDSNSNDESSFPTVSITDMDGMYDRVDEDGESSRFSIKLLTGSSHGAHLIDVELSIPTLHGDNSAAVSSHCQMVVHPTVYLIGSYTAASVKFQPLNGSELLIVVGTASPKSNKIHVYTCTAGDQSQQEVKHHGVLTGHLDWITSLEFLCENDGSFILASGSQDARIRLWKFHKPSIVQGDEKDQNELYSDNYEEGGDDEEEDDDDEFLEEGEARLHVHFKSNSVGMIIPVTLEALLIGHEEAVTGISWRPCQREGKPCLISSSMDRAIFIWMADMDGVWIPVSRVGSAGGILGGSVGSSLLGFVDTTFSPDGNCIVGHGYGGSLHFWTCETSGDDDDNDHGVWKANPGITGHFRGVSDIDWEVSTGEYLLSVGLDQTCRLWSHIPSIKCWMEVGRPQVHGYDLNTITCVGTGSTTSTPFHRFVSGADEKELRAFDAPISTLQLLKQLHPKNNHDGNSIEKDDLLERVDRAYIPSLGLSNRATATDAMEEGRDSNTISNTTQTNITEEGASSDITQILPNERDLGVTSLWPEVRKLFGHQTELVCLASNAHGRVLASENEDKRLIVASSCKARDAENASIRLWDVDSSTCTQVLKGGHKSTVATLSFSSDSTYLASSGKDRRLCLWKKTPNGFVLAKAIESAHKRIVWSVDFFSSNFLASGARDGFVKLWSMEKDDTTGNVDLVQVCQFEPICKNQINGQSRKSEPITALAFAPTAINNNMILAIGMECGRIEIWASNLLKPNECHPLMEFPHSYCHVSSVKKLVWKPNITGDKNYDDDQNSNLTLASCGLDHGVRIFNINIS